MSCECEVQRQNSNAAEEVARLKLFPLIPAGWAGKTLHQLLPPVRNVPYSLRPRAHDREVPVANATMRKNFIYRMLYLDSY